MRAAYRNDEQPSEQEQLAWLRLARTENVGPVSFFNLVDEYGSARKALDALPERARRAGRKKPLTIPPEASILREMEMLRRAGGEIICACDPAYPLALAATDDPPPVLSVLGNAALLARPCIGVVGARNASLNGRRFAEIIARELGAAGQVIVSGLARGIDTAAHVGALATGTVAVVAGGIDIVYPAENKNLYERICEVGAVIAESPLGSAPRAQDFPRRNRIVSGLSQGVIVVEATLRSGSLITARLAGEQGRDVYAVPGHPHDPRAEGPNALIRDGAALVRSAQDVLEMLTPFSCGTVGGFSDNPVLRFQPPAVEADESPPAGATAALSTEDLHTRLLAGLSFTPCEANELIRTAGAPTAQVNAALTELELAGALRRLPGNHLVLCADEPS